MNWLNLLGLPLPMQIEKVELGLNRLYLELTMVSPIACCSVCGRQSGRIHSHYGRRLQDLPWGKLAVRIELNCRKFFCDNATCRRVIFTEPLPEFAASYARRTERLQELFHWLGLVLSGEAASRLSRRICCSISGDTILRGLRRRIAQKFPTPRVLGVDDFAFRRGRRYGTVLVDLERHRVVDLLPDREAETLVNWLRSHPGVEVISRDRAGAYADGSRRGAPKAIQVADRWHLLKNAVDTLEKQLWWEQSVLKKVAKQNMPKQIEPSSDNPIEVEHPADDTVPVTPALELKAKRRQQRLTRYQQVHDLAKQGFSIRAMVRESGRERKTVRRFLRAGEQFPERASPKRHAYQLGPFQEYLQRRWREQPTPATRCGTQLFEEIRALGYRGCLSSVTHYLLHLRKIEGLFPTSSPEMTPRSRRQKQQWLSPRAVTWMLVKADADLEAEEREYVERLCADSSAIETARELVCRFFDLIRTRNSNELAPWLDEAESCGLWPLRNFALGLRRDLAAVTAALTSEWSNGQTEGQVNRIKFIKRSMYGRASFDLLRAKVLAPSDC